MINYNLALSIYRHSLDIPGAIAVASEEKQLNYGQVAEKASRLAETLRQSPTWQVDSKVLPRVAILGSRSIDACVAAIGAAWAGATYIPIGVKLPEEGILSILSQCGCSALVADEEGAQLLSARVLSACPPLVILPDAHLLPVADGSKVSLIDSESLSPSDTSQPALVRADDTAYIIFTSGTTGVPKGVMISAGSAHHYLTHITQKLGLSSTDRALETCELSFDFSVHNRFATWHAGAALYLLSATRVMNAVKFSRTEQLTVWNSVPSLAGMLHQIKALRPESLPDLRLTVFGGEPLTKGVVEAWQIAAPNSKIVNLYGPTEATVFCLHKSVNHPTPVTPHRDFVPIGKPLAGNEAAVLDANGDELVIGQVGELAIAGAQLAQGYVNDPELTAARFRVLRGKRWYLTGDQAMRDDAGEFHCLGRIDNQVKVSGYRIELEAVDGHLRAITGAEVVGAIAWPIHEGMARGIVGFIGAPSVDSEVVIAELKTRLPAYMVPSRILALPSMPFNQSGKVDRKALRQILEKESASTKC
ncbi:MAG: amino acid adenylation domain-containing protein [Betaproteobacteria bacterium]